MSGRDGGAITLMDVLVVLGIILAVILILTWGPHLLH